MRLVVMDKIPDDPELRRDWNRLALQMEEPEIFFTFEWAAAVQRAYAEPLAPLVFLGYESEELIGVAALARRKNGEVAFLTADTGDYCDFLCAVPRRHEFVAAVLSELRKRGVPHLVLTNLPQESSSVHALSSAAAGCKYKFHLRPAYACARVVLGSGEERLLLKQTLLAKKRLRRNMRELQKRGPVSIVHETLPEEIEHLLRPFSYMHVARFLETGKISSLVHAERREFLSELTRQAGAAGWVAMSRLVVGDLTAAWHFGFRFAGCWFWYQPTVNRVYGDFSPGFCLLAKIIEAACDSPDVRVVDLGLGAEGYKERFARKVRNTVYCELNRSLVRHAGTVVRHQAASVATASPAIEREIRKALTRLASVRDLFKSRGLGGVLSTAVRRSRHAISSSENVLFFGWPLTEEKARGFTGKLIRLDAELIGKSAILYGKDADAMRYLIRSAQRFESGNGQGFVLLDDEDTPVHFCWTTQFKGFYMAELGRKLETPSAHSQLIFDCYTPASARGRGYFSKAITLLAKQLRSQGNEVWIFGAETNLASLRGIRKTAFTHKFTLGQKTTFFLRISKDKVPAMVSIDRHEPDTVPSEPSNVHS